MESNTPYSLEELLKMKEERDKETKKVKSLFYDL